MGKIRTAEDFEDRLSEELVWRKKELSSLRQLIDLPNNSEQRQRILVRGGITLLYAHWEGFVKKSSQNYLEYVCQRKLRYDELTANFVAIAMKSRLNTATATKKASIYNEVAEFMMKELNARSAINPSGVIRTEWSEPIKANH